MDSLIEFLAKSGANVGLIAYSIFVTAAWVLADKERKEHVKTILKMGKEFNDALEPIVLVMSKCQTLLEVLTRGRQ